MSSREAILKATQLQGLLDMGSSRMVGPRTQAPINRVIHHKGHTSSHTRAATNKDMVGVGQAWVAWVEAWAWVCWVAQGLACSVEQLLPGQWMMMRIMEVATTEVATLEAGIVAVEETEASTLPCNLAHGSWNQHRATLGSNPSWCIHEYT
jgi:hypothetical protein